MQSQSITCFGVVKEVISSIFTESGIVPDEAIYSNIIPHLKSLHSYYRQSMPECGGPCYSEPLCQIAYLYRYAPIRANLVKYIFDFDSALEGYLKDVHGKKGNVDICVLGSGPATEMIGFAKWLKTNNLTDLDLRLLLLDQFCEWKNCCSVVETKILQYDLPIKISAFISLNSADVMAEDHLDLLQTSDIYIMSYVFSELRKQEKERRDMFVEIVKQAKSGSKFLFVDYSDGKETNESKIKIFARDVKISLSDIQYPKSRDMKAFPPRYNYLMDLPEEQKVNLGEIYTWLSKYGENPETSTFAFWVVGCKI